MGQNTETYCFKVSSREKFSIYNLLTQPNIRKDKLGKLEGYLTEPDPGKGYLESQLSSAVD